MEDRNTPTQSPIQTSELAHILPESLQRKERTRERDLAIIKQIRGLLLKMRAEAVINPQKSVKYADRLPDTHLNDDTFIELVLEEGEKLSQDLEIENIFTNLPETLDSLGIDQKNLLAAVIRIADEKYIDRLELKNTLKGIYLDKLTETRNQNYAKEILPFRVEQATHAGRNIAYLMIDLDRFKQVNDDNGHSFGDLILKAVAQGIQSSIRADDILVRSGGDEYTLVLFDIDQDNALKVARLIQEAVASTTKKTGLRLKAKDTYPESDHLTLSIGMALNQGNPFTEDDLRENADKALYAVKRSGRNGVAVYDPETMATIDTSKPLPR
jgi:diguanylate cyclase (GGDEF)-like protein